MSLIIMALVIAMSSPLVFTHEEKKEIPTISDEVAVVRPEHGTK